MSRTNSVSAASLVKYAHQTLRELPMFYTAVLEPILMNLSHFATRSRNE